jgi:hypothetical protein
MISDPAELVDIFERCSTYIKQARDTAEARHDDPNHSTYMDGSQWEIMQETEALLIELNGLITVLRKHQGE